MKSQLKAGVLLSYLISIAQALIQLLYTPIVLRCLGQEEYGLYTLAGSIVSYLSLCGLGFGSSYLRFYSQYRANGGEEEIASLNGMFFSIFSVIALISLLAGGFLVLGCGGILGSEITGEELETARFLMAVLVVNTAVTFLNTTFDSIIISQEAYIFQRLVRLLSILANPLFALPLLRFGYQSKALAVVTTALSFLTLAVNLFYCKKVIHAEFRFGCFDKKLLQQIAGFSVFIFINMIIDQINWNVDKFLLGRFYGTAAVAVYGIASQLNNIDINVSLSVSSVFAPLVNRMGAEGKEDAAFSELFVKTGRIQFMIMALLDSGLVLFGRPFIRLWAGENFDEAYFVMLFLVIPALIPCIENIGLEIQRAKNMHRFRSAAYLVMAVINVAISVPLSKMYGATGAAFGTSLSLIMGNGLLMNWYYYAKMGIDIAAFFKSLASFLPALFFSASAGIIIVKAVPINGWIELLVCGSAYTCIFCLSVWICGMNRREKEMIKNTFRRK